METASNLKERRWRKI